MAIEKKFKTTKQLAEALLEKNKNDLPMEFRFIKSKLVAMGVKDYKKQMEVYCAAMTMLLK